MRDRYEGYLEGSTTWNPGNLTLSTADATVTTVTVAGAKLGDYATASFSLDILDCILDAQVTAANTVSVTLSYCHDTTVNLGSGTLRARVYPS
ncbi:MAG: hypothetical protein ACYS6W_08705 [Planctomycetota bacterium]|jgi:hypothetical protein